MNAMDVIGYVGAGRTVCADCATDEDRARLNAVFPTDETDSPSHCDDCEDVIRESLTTDGERYVSERVQDALEGRGGRKCVLRQWVEAFAWVFADRPALRTLARSWPCEDEYSPSFTRIP